MDDREEKLIETLERIAKSQEELVKINEQRKIKEQKNIKENVLALIKYCREHNYDSCDSCPLNDPEYDQCMIKSVCCPAELCLF